MVNHHDLIHKTVHKKGIIHDYDIYKRNYPLILKQVVNVVDLGHLGYLGVEKDFPKQLSSIPNRKKRNLPTVIPTAKRIQCATR